MFVLLSKLLPIFVYPIGLTCGLLVISFLAKRQSQWSRIYVGIALSVLWLAGIKPVSAILVRSLEWRYLPPDNLPEAEIMVVLGGGTAPAQYPRQLVELGAAADRVFYASWLFHQGAAPRILLTGGYIPWTGQREGTPAENMAIIMDMIGVPDEYLILETESLNTYENAIFSKRILDQEGVDKIILVTSAQHMPRAVALFEKLGIHVIPAPTDFTITQLDWEQIWEPKLITQLFNMLPTVGNLSATTNVMKEYLGMLVYSLRGWI